MEEKNAIICIGGWKGEGLVEITERLKYPKPSLHTALRGVRGKGFKPIPSHLECLQGLGNLWVAHCCK